MRVLAIYGSRFGQAEAVLRRVAAVLARGGAELEMHRGDDLPPGLDPRDFDAVVIAASIIVGKHQRYIHDFVIRHREALNDRPTAFLSVCGSSPESDPEWQHRARGYVDQFLAATGWQPTLVHSCAGALRYPRYGLVTRWMMRMISRSHGGPTDSSREYEFTDWDAVARFAETFGEQLAPVAC